MVWVSFCATCLECGPASPKLPLFEYWVMLHVPRRRVWCDGPRLERLGMAWCYQRVTAGLAQACGHLWRHCTVRAVAAFYDMGWHTVKSIDKTRLREAVAEPDWSSIRYLAMDELAHRYATAEVAFPLYGRCSGSARSARVRQPLPFFERLLAGVAQRIGIVAIDMTTAYELEIRAHSPQAGASTTCPHGSPSTGDVLDRAGIDQANQLRHDWPGRGYSSRHAGYCCVIGRPRRFILAKSGGANRPLLTLYLLRES